MPMLSTGCCRCGERQRGAAIILAMLTIGLIAMIAARTTADYGRAVDTLAGRHDQAQARLLALAATDWARHILAADARGGTVDHAGEAWATAVPSAAAEGGEVGGELTEISGRFDVNSLEQGGRIDRDQLARYRRLLVLTGIDDDRAAALAVALGDWLDADDVSGDGGGGEADRYRALGLARRPANGRLANIDELALVAGHDEGLVAALRPYLTALPDAAPINLNTAPPEVLTATIDGLGIDEARTLAVRRVQSPFKDLADFRNRLGHPLTIDDPNRYSVASRYFIASVHARCGNATAHLRTLLDRQNTRPRIRWRTLS